MTSLSEEKNKLIKTIAQCHGFADYEIKVTAGSMKGDGYMGIINTVTITDNTRDLHLIVKSALTEEKLREQSPIKKAYEREAYMYETVFPAFRQLSEEFGIKNRFTQTARCYGTLLLDQEECIVLENLKEIDFRLWNRKVPMNDEHVALVFATYAKFHATGLAMKLLRPEKFEEIKNNTLSIFQKEEETEEDKEKMTDAMKHIFTNGFDAVAHDEEATRKLAKFRDDFRSYFMEEIKKFDKYFTLLHGDCWCNNMMFKYDDLREPTRPTDMCLLDWQISNIGSPIFDLSYFFYACSSKETLYNVKRFLRIYHSNLAETVREAGLDPDEVLTFEELETQWKKHSRFGLFMALFVMRVVLSEVEEAPDLSELAKSGKSIVESITSAKSSNAALANRRIADVIIFMSENDYL